MEHLNKVCGLVCLLGKVAETMPTAQCPLPGGKIRTARNTQAGEYGRLLLPYTEIFPGCTMLCIAYLAIIQIKRVSVLYAHSQSHVAIHRLI